MVSLAGPTLRMVNTWSGSIDDTYHMCKRDSFLKQALKKMTETATKPLECPICYEGYLKDRNVILLPCGHLFHDACHKIWQPYDFDKKPCPYCMQIIEPAVILSDKGEEYSCSLDTLQWENSFFSPIEWMIEDLIRLKKKLAKTGEGNFDPLLRSFFELLKTYHSLKTNPYSNLQINALVKKHVEDLLCVLFSLDFSIRIKLFGLVAENLNRSLFWSDNSFESIVRRIGNRFFYQPKNPQSYFIGSFCYQLSFIYLDLKQEQKKILADLKAKIFDKIFRVHLLNIKAIDPSKQDAYFKEMPQKYLLDFIKRIEKMDGIPDATFRHARKIQEIRANEEKAFFACAVVAITVVILGLIFRYTFKEPALSS